MTRKTAGGKLFKPHRHRYPGDGESCTCGKVNPGPGRRLDNDEPTVYRTVGWLESHWNWLMRQPGGAATTLRAMVERAMKRKL